MKTDLKTITWNIAINVLMPAFIVLYVYTDWVALFWFFQIFNTLGLGICMMAVLVTVYSQKYSDHIRIGMVAVPAWRRMVAYVMIIALTIAFFKYVNNYTGVTYLLSSILLTFNRLRLTGRL